MGVAVPISGSYLSQLAKWDESLLYEAVSWHQSENLVNNFNAEPLNKQEAEDINNNFDDPLSQEVFQKVITQNKVSLLEKNGRIVFDINGYKIAFSKPEEFQLENLSGGFNDNYSFDNIIENWDFEKFSEEVDLPLLSSDKFYEIFWSIEGLDIESNIDKNFFTQDTEESQNLLKAFRILTWCEGKIPISINNEGKASYLVFGEDDCGYIRNRYSDNTNITILLWK